MYVHSTHLRKFVEIEFQSSWNIHSTRVQYYMQGNKMHVFALTARHILALSSSVRSEKKLPLEDIFCLFLENCQQNDVTYVGNCPFYLVFSFNSKK